VKELYKYYNYSYTHLTQTRKQNNVSKTTKIDTYNEIGWYVQSKLRQISLLRNFKRLIFIFLFTTTQEVLKYHKLFVSTLFYFCYIQLGRRTLDIFGTDITVLVLFSWIGGRSISLEQTQQCLFYSTGSEGARYLWNRHNSARNFKLANITTLYFVHKSTVLQPSQYNNIATRVKYTHTTVILQLSAGL